MKDLEEVNRNVYINSKCHNNINNNINDNNKNNSYLNDDLGLLKINSLNNTISMFTKK